MEENLSTDTLLKELGGCGRFQYILASVAYLPQISFAFTMLFMSFGAYNPGWACASIGDGQGIQNYTNASMAKNANGILMEINLRNRSYEASCSNFEKCDIIEFDPSSVTIVTEWDLICDKTWIPSVMASLQMLGVSIGTFLNGFCGDKFGRKKTLFTFLFFNIVFNAVAIFSVSWEMYTVIRILLGITCGIIGYTPLLFITEFVSVKWRVRTSSLPLWSFGAMLFAFTTMVTRNWKYVHLCTAAISSVAFLPFFWVPESLRWLIVNRKHKEAMYVSKRIAKLNNQNIQEENIQSLISMRENKADKLEEVKTATIRDLFRHGTILYTLILGAVFFSVDFNYYAMSFGIAALPGNIFINMIVSFALELLANPISFTAPNILGRKVVCLVNYAVLTCCLIGVILSSTFAEGQTQVVITLILTIISKICLGVEWYVILTFVHEIYPTVVRSTATGFGGFMASLGSIIAPYVLSADPDQLIIGFSILSAFTLFCCCLLTFLPETNGKPLQDTWDE